MTTTRGESARASRAGYRPDPTQRAKGLVDLDADQPPMTPAAIRASVMSVRLPPSLRTWIHEQAKIEQTSVNAWMVRALARERDASLPADVRDWLAAQSAQCGCPGDLDQALIKVIRHLALRWPHGGRLH